MHQPLSLPEGPITGVRAKRFKTTLNCLIQQMFDNNLSTVRGDLVTLVVVDVGHDLPMFQDTGSVTYQVGEFTQSEAIRNTVCLCSKTLPWPDRVM